MMGDEGHYFFGGGFMWIFWVLIIIGLFFVFKNIAVGGDKSNSSNNDTPLEILKKRYARGEIEEEEYERRRKELES